VKKKAKLGLQLIDVFIWFFMTFFTPSTGLRPRVGLFSKVGPNLSKKNKNIGSSSKILRLSLFF